MGIEVKGSFERVKVPDEKAKSGFRTEKHIFLRINDLFKHYGK